MHDSEEEPVDLWSELDGVRMEVRKVEVFADGSFGYAGPERRSRSRLGERPVPPLEEIAADPQFVPQEISADEFERIWARALRSDGE